MAKQIIEYTEQTAPNSDDALELQEAAGGPGSSKKVQLKNILAAFVDAFPELTITLGGETAPTQATIDDLVNNYGFKVENVLWVESVVSSPSLSPSVSPSSSPSGTLGSSPSDSPSVSPSSSPSTSVSDSPSTSPSISVSSSPSSSVSPSDSPSDSPSTSPSGTLGSSPSDSPSVSPSASPSDSPSDSPSVSPSSSPSVSPSSSPSATGAISPPTGLSASDIKGTTFTLTWDISPETIELSEYDTMGLSHSSTRSLPNWQGLWDDTTENFSADVAGYSGSAVSYEDTNGASDTGIIRCLIAFPIPTNIQTPTSVSLNLNCNVAHGGDVRAMLSTVTTPLGTATDVDTTLHDTNATSSIDTSTTGSKSVSVPVSWITGAAGGDLVLCLRENAYDTNTIPGVYPSIIDQWYGGQFDVVGDTTPAYLEFTY